MVVEIEIIIAKLDFFGSSNFSSSDYNAIYTSVPDPFYKFILLWRKY